MGQHIPCDICGETDFILKFQLYMPKRQIVQCRNCNLVLVNPPAKNYLSIDFEDKILRKDKYDQINQVLQENFGLRDKAILEQEERWKEVHFRSRVAEIRKYCNSGKLLDVGCSHGFFLSAVSQEHFEIYGVEPCEISSNMAKARFDERIFCGTLKEAHLPENNFDIVTMINVIEHVASPKEILQESNRVLKPGGLLMIETPTLDNWWPRVLKERWWNYKEMEHHFFFSFITLKNLLDITGFVIIDRIVAYKLLSLRYLLYQINRYNRKLTSILLWVTEVLGLADSPIKFPQKDEMIVFARK